MRLARELGVDVAEQAGRLAAAGVGRPLELSDLPEAPGTERVSGSRPRVFDEMALRILIETGRLAGQVVSR
ncbi:MAG: hypothetical protein ABJA74_06640 [Lapillicoccus sp.]